MRNVHIWKTKTEEGEKREVRAERFAQRWRVQAKVRGEEDWTYYDTPLLEDLVELRDILWRKYQRKRLPFTDFETIDRMIRERGGPTVDETKGSDGADEEEE